MAWPSSIRAAFSRYTVTSPEMKREAPAGVNSTPKRKTAAPGKNHSNDRPGVFRGTFIGRCRASAMTEPLHPRAPGRRTEGVAVSRPGRDHESGLAFRVRHFA